MLKSGGSILDANPGSDLDAIQQKQDSIALSSAILNLHLVEILI